MSKNTNMLEHHNVFHMLITQLSILDVEDDDDYKAILLFASLPTSYDHLVTMLMYLKETLKLEGVQCSPST